MGQDGAHKKGVSLPEAVTGVIQFCVLLDKPQVCCAPGFSLPALTFTPNMDIFYIVLSLTVRLGHLNVVSSTD